MNSTSVLTNISYIVSYDSIFSNNPIKWLALLYAIPLTWFSFILAYGVQWYHKYGCDPAKRTIRNSFLYWWSNSYIILVFFTNIITKHFNYAFQIKFPEWFCSMYDCVDLILVGQVCNINVYF